MRRYPRNQGCFHTRRVVSCQELSAFSIIGEPKNERRRAPMRYYQYTPTIEEFATVTAAAILFGWWLMRKLFPSLLRDLPDWVASGMIISISGVMSLPYRPTIHRIAKSFGIKSHDTLERCVMHTSWNVAIIMAGILNFLLTSVCGSPSMGYLILDDVLCDRRGGKKLPYVYKLYFCTFHEV